MIKPFITPMLAGRKAAGFPVGLYNFTAQSEYGILKERVLDFSLDTNTIKFKTGALVGGVSSGNPRVTVIGQQLTNASFSLREFYLVTDSNGDLQFLLGGEFTTFAGMPLLPNNSYELVINKKPGTSTLKNLTLATESVRSTNDGESREPDAPCIIGALVREGVYSLPMQGVLYDVELNGILWPMRLKNNANQESVPVGNPMTLVNMIYDNWV